MTNHAKNQYVRSLLPTSGRDNCLAHLWRTMAHLFIANAANVGLDIAKEGKCRSTT
jgi:hypothetical protein